MNDPPRIEVAVMSKTLTMAIKGMCAGTGCTRGSVSTWMSACWL